MEREGRTGKALYFLSRDAAPSSPSQLSTPPADSNQGKEKYLFGLGLQLSLLSKGTEESSKTGHPDRGEMSQTRGGLFFNPVWLC